jgi:hypothetical protein
MSPAHGVRRPTSAHICGPPCTCPHVYRKQPRRRRPAARRSILGGPGSIRNGYSDEVPFCINILIFLSTVAHVREGGVSCSYIRPTPAPGESAIIEKKATKMRKKWGWFRVRIPRHAPAAKFVVESSYIHDPSTLAIGTGAHCACVVEVTFQAKVWGAIEPGPPPGPPGTPGTP